MKRKKTAPPSDQHKRTVLDPLKLNLSPTPPDIHFGPPPSDEKRKAAIFVVHGMGQQIPLETLDESARRLLSVSGAPETTDIRSRTVQAGKKRFQRVEFDLCDASQQVIEVHLYEGYWAPITEGKVTLRDVIGFLWYAGTSGLLKREKTFCRWLFGGLADFPIPSNSRRNIFLAFLTLLAMGIIGALISLIAAANLFSVSLAYRWPSADLLQTLTIILRIFIGCLAIFVVPLSLVYFFKTQLQTCWFWKPLNTLLWWLFFLELGITILVGGLMFSYSLYDFFHVLPAPLVPTGQSAMPPGWKWWLVWGGLFWGLVYIRSFLIQYLGDVAAYVASHRLDRFRKIRTRIRNTVYDVLYAIYAQNDDQGRPVYHHVGLMGHSLGSVIAYESLNALLNEDALNEGKMKVAERTSVLVTFGSPLDKIAYIFSLEGQHTSATREALAASAQPLIRDYAKYRRLQWINVYTPRDIIGGSLEFYDKQFDISTEFQEDLNIGVMSDALRTEFECRGFALSEQPKLKITSSALDESWNLCDEEHGTFIISRDRKSLHVCAEQRVKNVLDSDAMIPLIAHTELWKTKTTFTEFYQAFR